MIRPLTSADRETVLQISRRIWSGGDYLPNVLDKWLADTKGVFFGYFEDKQLVAFGKISILAPGYAWLEGLRKDPRSKTRGVAAIINTWCLDWLKEHGPFTHIRFSTYVANLASITSARKAGFKEVLSYSFKERVVRGNPRPLDQYPLVSLTAEDERLYTFWQASAWQQAMQGWIVRDWIVYPYTKEWMVDCVKEHTAIGWEENGQLTGLLVANISKHPHSLWVSHLSGCNEQVRKGLFEAARNLARLHKLSVISVVMPAEQTITRPFSQLGFKSWEVEKDFLVFSYPADKL